MEVLNTEAPSDDSGSASAPPFCMHRNITDTQTQPEKLSIAGFLVLCLHKIAMFLQNNSILGCFVMGRKEAEDISPESLQEMLTSGKTRKEIAKEYGVSLPTLSKRIADLRMTGGPLMHLRNLRGLRFTEIQAKALDAVTPDKIEGASLLDLAKAYKVLVSHEKSGAARAGKASRLLTYLRKLEESDSMARENNEPYSA